MQARRQGGLRSARVRSSVHTLVERLEGRRLLAAVSWDGGGDGTNWTDANNWSTNALPSAADDVTINVAGTPTIIVNGGGNAVRSVNVAETFRVEGGSLTVSAASAVSGAFTLAGGSVGGVGTFTHTGSFDWTGGAIEGNGTTNVNGPANFTVPDFNYLYITDRRLVLNVNATLGGATGAGNGYGVLGNGNARVEVAANRTLTLADGVDLFAQNGTPTLIVNGTLAKSDEATSTTSFRLDARSASTIAVAAGTLELTGVASTILNAVTVAADATLDLGGNGTLLDTSSGVTGAGTVRFSGVGTTVSGTYDVAGATRSTAGSTTFVPDANLVSPGATLDVSGGTLDLSSGEPINVDALRLSAGTLTGLDDHAVSGAFDWTGGILAGSAMTTVNGTTTATMPDFGHLFIDGRTLVLNADATVGGAVGSTNGYVVFGYGAAVIRVNADRTLTLADGVDLIYQSGTPTLDVRGTLAKAGKATSYTSFAVDVPGTIAVDAGAFELSLTGTVSGAVTVAAGATFVAGGSNLAFAAASSITGAGVVRFSGGATTFAGTYDVAGRTESTGGATTFESASIIASLSSTLDVSGGTLDLSSGDDATLATLTLSGGTLTGSNDQTVTGAFAWTGGTLAGTGTTTATGAATMTVPSFNHLYLDGRTLVLDADATLGGPGAVNGYGVLGYGDGVLEVAVGSTLALADGVDLIYQNGNPTLIVRGTLAMTTQSASYTSFAVDVPGTIAVTAGQFDISGTGTLSGATTVASGATFVAGGSNLTFAATSSISGAGVVRFSGSGTTFDGAYDVSGRTESTSGSATFNAASTVASLGTALDITGGTLELNSGNAITAPTLRVSGGSLSGSDVVDASTLFEWTGGTLAGSGSTTARGTVTLTVPQFNHLFLDGRRLTLDADATLSGPGVVQGYAMLGYGDARLVVPAGRTFTLPDGADLSYQSGNPTLRVEGTLVKSGIPDSTLSFALDNVGLVDLQEGTLNLAGTTNIGDGGFLAGGRYLVADGATLDFAAPITTLTADIEFNASNAVPDLASLTLNRGRVGLEQGADLTITPDGGAYVQEGIVDLSPGSRLTVNGDMRFAGASQPIVRTEIAGPTTFGSLRITGDLDLNSPDSTSCFDPDLVPGYDPAAGTQFNVITTTTRPIANGFDALFGGTTPSGRVILATRPNATTVAVVIGTGTPPPAPQILSQAFDFETREALLFGFDQDVSAFLSRKDYTLVNLTTGTAVPQSAGVLSYNPTSNQAVLTLTGLLADGDYRLTIQAGDIANPAGVPLTGGLTLDFFVLRGDVDRNRSVGFADLVRLAQNYGQSGRTYSQGNVDYSPDGTVGFSDLVTLAQNYGVTLGAGVANAAAPPPARGGKNRPGVAADVLA